MVSQGSFFTWCLIQSSIFGNLHIGPLGLPSIMMHLDIFPPKFTIRSNLLDIGASTISIYIVHQSRNRSYLTWDIIVSILLPFWLPCQVFVIELGAFFKFYHDFEKNMHASVSYLFLAIPHKDPFFFIMHLSLLNFSCTTMTNSSLQILCYPSIHHVACHLHLLHLHLGLHPSNKHVDECPPLS